MAHDLQPGLSSVLYSRSVRGKQKRIWVFFWYFTQIIKLSLTIYYNFSTILSNSHTQDSFNSKIFYLQILVVYCNTLKQCFPTFSSPWPIFNLKIFHGPHLNLLLITAIFEFPGDLK